MEKPTEVIQYTEEDIRQMQTLIGAIQALRTAKDMFNDWRRNFKGKTKEMAIEYENRITWIYNNITSSRNIRQEVLKVIREEWNSDVYEVDEIAQKSKLLPSESRATLIQLLDAMIAGETITLLENETTD